MSVTSQQLRQAADTMNMRAFFENELVIEKCASLCNRFSIKTNVLLERMEAFLVNKNLEKLGLDTLGRFETNLLEISQKKILTPEPVAPTGKRPLPTITPLAAKTPKHENGESATSKLETSFSQATGIAYAQRTSSKQIVQSYNPELATKVELLPEFTKSSSSSSTRAKCKILMNDDDFENIGTRFRYMYTTLEERAKSLEKHLLTLQKDMCALINLDETTLTPVGIPSPEIVWNCGRIYCESAEGRINATSIILEGSRHDSYGRRIKLDMKELSSFSLFPGQIILVEGINASGRQMIVKRIVEGVSKPSLLSNPKQLHEYHHSVYYQNHQSLQIMIGTGPFTTSDNLLYRPLTDLLGIVLDKRPDVLILIGPFVDIQQPLLSTPEIKLMTEEEEEAAAAGRGGEKENYHIATHEMVFMEKIIRDHLLALYNTVEDMEAGGEGGGYLHTQIIIIPSLTDAHHDFVFPQPPFGNRDAIETSFFEESLGVYNIPHSSSQDPKKRIHLISNPCMFRVNEILFGICSSDILFGLSCDEISKEIEGNRITKLASHMIAQQSFCPQFPVPSNTISQLDLRHARHWEFKKKPDVLITPSRLAPFAKEILGTVVINPGTLVKGTSGGTFAQMTINPYPESVLTDLQKQHIDEYPHNLPQRTAVDIIKI